MEALNLLSAVVLDARFLLILIGVICEALAGLNVTASGKISFMPLGFAFFGAAFLV